MNLSEMVANSQTVSFGSRTCSITGSEIRGAHNACSDTSLSYSVNYRIFSTLRTNFFTF